MFWRRLNIVVSCLFFFTACGGVSKAQKEESSARYLEDFGEGEVSSVYWQDSEGEELPAAALEGSSFNPIRGEAFILSESLKLNLKKLNQDLKEPRVRVRKIVNGKSFQVKKDEFSWSIHEQNMFIDMEQGLYLLVIKSREDEKKRFHRNIWLHKSENGAIQVSLPSAYSANNLFPGKWQGVGKSSYGLSWLESFPETSNKNIFADGAKGLIRLHRKKVIWAHPNGDISLGHVQNKKVTWLHKTTPNQKIYKNRRLPTALVFSGRYVYLGTYGNGIYVGRIAKDRIKWLKHYSSVPYVAALALEGSVLAIGSFDEGLSVASVKEDEINVHNVYTKDDFPRATTNSITTLELLDGVLLWNTYGDQFYSARVVEHTLSELSTLDFPRDVVSGVTSRVVSTTPVGESVFVSTDTAALFSMEWYDNEMEWEDFYAHHSLDTKLSDEPFTNLAIFNDELIIAGAADGLRLGIDGGYRNREVNWFKHHHVAKDKKLLADRVYDLQLHHNMLFVLNHGGLNTARLKYWTQWKQIS